MLAEGAGTEGRLSMARVVSVTGRVIGRNIVGITLMCVLATLISEIPSVLALLRVWGSTPGELGMRSIANSVGGSLATGGITFMVLGDLDGRRVGVGAALGAGFRFLLPLLGLGLVMGLGIGLASILLLVPGLMLAMRWAVATPARMAEGASLGDSMRRSGDLTAGNRWRLLGLAVVLTVFLGLLLVLFSVALWAAEVEVETFPAPGRLGTDFLLNFSYHAFSSAGLAVCYVELQRLRDGSLPSQLASFFT